MQEGVGRAKKQEKEEARKASEEQKEKAKEEARKALEEQKRKEEEEDRKALEEQKRQEMGKDAHVEVTLYHSNHLFARLSAGRFQSKITLRISGLLGILHS